MAASSAGGDKAATPQGAIVAVTPLMVETATATLASSAVSSASKQQLEQVSWKAGGRAPFACVQLLVTTARDAGRNVYLHELMQGSRIVVVPPAKAEPNPELLARRKKLQAAVEEQAYQRRYGRMDGPKGMRSKYVAPLDVQEGRKIFALVTQLLITMAACFAAGWYSVGMALSDDPALMALGGVAFMVTAVAAELYFLMKTSLLTPNVAPEKDR
eukprot:m.45047 g.45047  ORF g.45047 m.45047 type:complete len:215 (+) comp6603_c0_seq1:222-866(+)